MSALARLHPEVDTKIIDFWTFLSENVRQDIQGFYLRLISDHPEVYNKIYHMDVEEWREMLARQKPISEVTFLVDSVRHMFDVPLGKILLPNRETRERIFINLALRKLTKPSPLEIDWLSNSTKWLLKRILHQRIKETIKIYNPAAIVTTQVWPSFLLSFLKTYGKPSFNVPLISVVTDYGVNTFWTEARATELFFVASDEMAATVRLKGFAAEKVRVTGIPITTNFLTPPSKKEALDSLSLDPFLPTLLIMGGGLGVGMEHVVDALDEIAKMKCNLIIITGENPVLFAKISSQKIAAMPNVKLFDRTDNMLIPLVAADIVLSKPGGLTVAEAFAVGRPLFIPFYIGGQERYNVEYIKKHNLGIVLEDARSFTEVIRKHISDADGLLRWQEHVKKFGHPEASLSIARDIMNLI